MSLSGEAAGEEVWDEERGFRNDLELGENASELSFVLTREGSEHNRME